MLATNSLRKDLISDANAEKSLALNVLGVVADPELAKSLIQEIARLHQSTDPYIRKKAILCLYKCYHQFPEGLLLTYDVLKLALNDPDPGVVNCAVNVVCELSHNNPNNFLPLVPQLFASLSSSKNNWMLIKTVKLFASMLPQEPRLARKLLEPLAKLAQSTTAKSLMFECVHTITKALVYCQDDPPPFMTEVVCVCASKLREYVDADDPNLKYLGLVGLLDLIVSHPAAVKEHKALILQCLLDEDISIRTRALELITGMASYSTLPDIVKNLFTHVEHSTDEEYKALLVEKIVFMCTKDAFSNILDFDWYVAVLMDLLQFATSPRNIDLLSMQLFEVGARVCVGLHFLSKYLDCPL